MGDRHGLYHRTRALDELPSLNAAIKEPKGTRKEWTPRFFRTRTSKWRAVFDIFKAATLPVRKRLLTQSGHGTVAYLTSHTPAAYATVSELYCVARCKCSGVAALGDSPLCPEDSCPHCDMPPTGATHEALEHQHIVRCPRTCAWLKVHARAATTALVCIL